jgi:N-dimethylarginine dimethylaminohydrolase
MHQLLLCPPDFYAIRYEINPWMSRRREVDGAQAVEQWRRLRELLVALGCEVEMVRPEVGWPDMVFTANAGLVAGGRFIPSNFRHAERSGEEARYRAWFSTHGFEVDELPPDVCFEGEGDALFCGDVLFCGWPFRTDMAAHELLAERLNCRSVSLRLVDPRFYHLDTCFCPLDDEAAAWCPGAFDAPSRARLAEEITDLVEVTEEEALRFGCNAVVLGRDVVLPEGCPKLSAALAVREFRTHATPMGEFIKAGGACKCLVLHLNAERPGQRPHLGTGTIIESSNY